jgi:hypothetical protein
MSLLMQFAFSEKINLGIQNLYLDLNSKDLKKEKNESREN